MMLRPFTYAIAWLVAGAAAAQLPTTVDAKWIHDAPANAIRISLRANGMGFDGVISNLVFTIRWPESSPATLGIGSAAWCPSPSVAFPVVPTSMVAPGNGYKYRTYYSVGLAALGATEDDGGCGQSLPADEWVEVYAIPVNNDPGDTFFEVADDDFTQVDNRAYFISLNGIASTGAIIGFSTSSQAEPTGRMAPAVFPNPATHESRLVLPAEWIGAWRATVLDAAGRAMCRFSGADSAVPVVCEGLVNGAYVLRIEGEAGMVSAPFLVER